MMNIKWTAISQGADIKFLDERINEANEQLKYMSQTIDDFRNFFKPNKEKECFDLKNQIKKAYKISQETLLYNNINLQVDTIPNATYTWYRKTSAVDSTLISTNQTYNIPYLLPSDTGLYVCKASVNSGCLSRVSYFNLTGNCNGFSTLAVNGVKLNGTIQQDQSQLQWETTAGFAADAFVVERSIDGSNFKSIGTAKASVNAATSKSVYYFTDAAPVAGKNFYRLRLVKAGKADAYSNIITLQLNSSSSISVIPNPVQDQFEVKFGKISQSATYQVSLRGSDGRLLMSQSVHISAGESKRFQRPANTPTGVYYLQTINLTTNEQNVSKLIFK